MNKKLTVKTAVVADLAVGGGGTVYTLVAGTDAGREWINARLGSADDWQWLGRALVIEHRYIADIVAGAREDGLVVC